MVVYSSMNIKDCSDWNCDRCECSHGILEGRHKLRTITPRLPHPGRDFADGLRLCTSPQPKPSRSLRSLASRLPKVREIWASFGGSEVVLDRIL